MKSVVNLAAPVAQSDEYPNIALGDKGNIWLRFSETDGVVIGTVEGASKPKAVGYLNTSPLKPNRFEPLPAGTEITITV